MDTLAADFITLLRYLLPGFLAAWVFYGFTSFQKPSQFERVIQALIFTLIVQVFVFLARESLDWIGQFWLIGVWTDDIELVVSVVIAIILGTVFAYFANNDSFHKFARTLGVTRETSYSSEWFGEFSKNVTYVVLHLPGQRRLYGWPREWPSTPNKGHFAINQAVWLTDDGSTPLLEVDTILIAAEDVEMVEFLNKTWEKKNG